MSISRRVARFVSGAAISMAAAYVLLVAAIQVQQRILRHRVEDLLADVRSLQVRRSTFAQAAVVFSHWSNRGSYSVPCSQEFCHFSIGIYDFGSASGEFSGWYTWEILLYRMAGSRLAGANASISVRNGTVSGAFFELGIDVPPFIEPTSDKKVSYELAAGIRTNSRVDPNSLLYPNPHPDYTITGPDGCEGCIEVWFEYTPYANAADVDRVGRPNFACITSWSQCRTKADIMPAAMAQRALDPSSDVDAKASCSARGLQIISRDAEDAAVVDVVANRPDSECDGCRLLNVRLVKRFKRAAFWPVGAAYNLGVVQSIAISPLDDAANLKPGTRIIIVFDRNLHPRGPVPILEEVCGVVPLNEQMLTIVQSGISKDDLPPWSGNPNFIRPWSN
jgi:hypothetical protein